MRSAVVGVRNDGTRRDAASPEQGDDPLRTGEGRDETYAPPREGSPVEQLTFEPCAAAYGVRGEDVACA